MNLVQALIAGVSAICLSGCAGALVQDDWNAQPTHAALPAHHIEIAEADLQRVCGGHAGVHLYGCSQRVVEAKVCLIYTPPQPAAWLMEHEKKHCAGWDHSPLPGSNTTRVAAGTPVHHHASH